MKHDRRPARRRARNLARAVAVAATLAGTYTYSAEAEAAIPRALREGTRPWYFLFGVGGSFHLRNRFHGYGYADSFRLQQEIGYHFQGKSEGPALAFMTQQDFGRFYTGGFTFSGKFLWDIRPVRGLGFYISPFGTAGYHLTAYDRYNTYYGYYGRTHHFVSLQFGVTGKLMVEDRWVFWLQFPSIEFLINRWGWGARFMLMTGAGVTFG